MNKPRVHNDSRPALLTLALAGAMLILPGCPMPTPDTDTADNNPLPNPVFDRALANRAPVAQAGADQDAQPGQSVVLNGVGSSDPDGDRLSFVWTQLSGPNTIEFTTGQSSAIVRFTAPAVTAPEQYVFSLTVVDGFAVDIDEVVITIAP